MEQKNYTKEMTLTFPVIRKSRAQISLLKAVAFSVITISLVYFIIYRTVAKTDYALNLFYVILFILAIAVTLFVNFFLQKFKFGGVFSISDTEITLTTTNKRATFSLKDIKNLKMCVNCLQKNRKNLSGMKSWLFGEAGGSGNYVEFIHNEDFYSFEIYLKNKAEEDLFLKRGIDLNAGK